MMTRRYISQSKMNRGTPLFYLNNNLASFTQASQAGTGNATIVAGTNTITFATYVPKASDDGCRILINGESRFIRFTAGSSTATIDTTYNSEGNWTTSFTGVWNWRTISTWTSSLGTAAFSNGTGFYRPRLAWDSDELQLCCRIAVNTALSRSFLTGNVGISTSATLGYSVFVEYKNKSSIAVAQQIFSSNTGDDYTIVNNNQNYFQYVTPTVVSVGQTEAINNRTNLAICKNYTQTRTYLCNHRAFVQLANISNVGTATMPSISINNVLDTNTFINVYKILAYRPELTPKELNYLSNAFKQKII